MILPPPFPQADYDLFRALCLDMDPGVILHGADGTIIYYNSASERILDTTLHGSTSADVESQYTMPDFKRRKQDRPSCRALIAGESSLQTVEWRARDGTKSRLRISTCPLHENGDREKTCAALTVFVEDDSAGPQLDLVDENEVLRRMVDRVPARISSFDRRGRNLFANAMAEQVRGFAPGQAKGCSVFDIMGPQWLRKYHLHVEGVMAGREQQFSTVEIDGDGRTKHSAVRYLPKKRHGSPEGFFAIAAEITRDGEDLELGGESAMGKAALGASAPETQARVGYRGPIATIVDAHVALQRLASNFLESRRFALEHSLQLLRSSGSARESLIYPPT